MDEQAMELMTRPLEHKFTIYQLVQQPCTEWAQFVQHCIANQQLIRLGSGKALQQE